LESSFNYGWIRLGAVCGLLTSVIYPALAFGSLPELAAIALACAIGPLLGVASIGLYHFMAPVKKTVSLQIAAAGNVLAGSFLTMMLLVQSSLFLKMEKAITGLSDEATADMLKAIWRGVDSVQLGLDVLWDVYISIGTILFAMNMLKHPRFGRVFGFSGMVFGAALLALNIYTFPAPPWDAGLIDLGPLVGLWYLAVTIQVFRSFRWVRESGTF